MAEPAAQFTWIFTSILSSEDLLKIEPLLSRTKVLCTRSITSCLVASKNISISSRKSFSSSEG